MSEVRALFSTAIHGDGQSSSSGLSIDNSPNKQADCHAQQYGLFATSDYKAGDVILEESPIAVFSHLLEASSSGNQKPAVAATSSVRDMIRSQFNETSFSAEKSDEKEDESSKQKEKASPLANLVIPKHVMGKINSSSAQSIEARTKKLRGMILAAATYAIFPLSNEETKQKLFQLYHPSLDTQDDEEIKAVELARLSVQCCKELAAPDGSLHKLLHSKSDKDEAEMIKVLLIYSCNAFEGGRIYDKLSRANHSCNPNAVVVQGETVDLSILKAACPISKGSEITISYIGKALYAGFPIRQRKLRMEKHFECKCTRCTGNNGKDILSGKIAATLSLDLASCIPCPVCHPRSSRYLDEDLMFDEEDDDLQVCYALAENGMTAEERNLHCISCGGVTSVSTQGSVRKKKEGMTINYMTMAEDKVYDQIETNKFSEGEVETSDEQEVDRSLLHMATATCGAKHWTTQILNLDIIEETLANLHATLMSIDPENEEKMMEEIFTDIAECADGIEKAFEYAKSLKLNLDPAHWLFDYVLGLSRLLVGLGDEKSQKYGADWIARVEDYTVKYESEGMKKVVGAIKNAWKRNTKIDGSSDEAKNDSNDEKCNGQAETKRRKLE